MKIWSMAQLKGLTAKFKLMQWNFQKSHILHSVLKIDKGDGLNEWIEVLFKDLDTVINI